MHGLRTDVFRHLQRQSIAFFTRTRSGEVQSRLTHDISGMQAVITSTATSIASNVDDRRRDRDRHGRPQPAPVAALAARHPAGRVDDPARGPAAPRHHRPPPAPPRRPAQPGRGGPHRQRQTLIKTLGAGEATADRFTATSTDLIDLEMRSQLAGRWRMATMQIIFAAIPALIYLAAGFPATSGGMTIGTLIAFTTLQAGIFRPLMGLLNVGAQWVTSMALFSRIFGYLDLPVEVAAAGRSRCGAARPRSVARCASRASASATTRRAADDVCRRRRHAARARGHDAGSRRRDRLGQVEPRRPARPPARPDRRGASPSTASTCATSTRDDLARIVGVVSQDTYLVHASIRDNLLLAAPDATEDELWRALAAAQVAAARRQPARAGSTRSSAPAATGSPAARSSASPSPAPCCATLACSCSTRPPAPSTTRPSASSRRPSTRLMAAAPPSPSRTACRRSGRRADRGARPRPRRRARRPREPDGSGRALCATRGRPLCRRARARTRRLNHEAHSPTRLNPRRCVPTGSGRRPRTSTRWRTP